MNIINKIGILINWSRELDMYYELVKQIPKNKIELIINDVNSLEKGRDTQFKIIKNIFKKNKINYKLFSKVYKKQIYKVLISTGEVSSQKVSFYSLARFLFAHSFGLFFEITRISKFFMILFKRPYTAGGLKCTLGMNWYPEKRLGNIVIKYPDGMDIKLKKYPYDEYKKIFDIYFVHGRFEQKLIEKKFSSKITHIMGYPRFLNLSKDNDIKKKLYMDFNLDKRKKLIYWTPTNVDMKGENFLNILLWMDKIAKLQKDYNIIIRPHPKTLTLAPEIEIKLKKLNFFIDKDHNRKIGEIIKISDLVLSDYGGTIFSAIFLSKPIILLNLNHGSKFVYELRYLNSLDLIIRKSILNLETGISIKNIFKAVNQSQERDYKKKIINYKQDFFGPNNKLSINLTKKFLLNLL